MNKYLEKIARSIRAVHICKDIPEVFADLDRVSLASSNDIHATVKNKVITVQEIREGKLTKKGLAKYFVLVSDKEILFWNDLRNIIETELGHTFTLSEFDIDFSDVPLPNIYQCPYCRTEWKEDNFHSGTCENCGGPSEEE